MSSGIRHPEIYSAEFIDWLEKVRVIERSPKYEENPFRNAETLAKVTIGRDILESLLERWGYWRSPEHITGLIYGRSEESEIFCLKSNINYLRPKLPQGIVLLTVPGVGYSLGIREVRIRGPHNIRIMALIYDGQRRGEPLTKLELAKKLYGDDDEYSLCAAAVSMSYANSKFLHRVGLSIVNLDGVKRTRGRYGFKSMEGHAVV